MTPKPMTAPKGEFIGKRTRSQSQPEASGLPKKRKISNQKLISPQNDELVGKKNQSQSNGSPMNGEKVSYTYIKSNKCSCTADFLNIFLIAFCAPENGTKIGIC